MKLRTQLQPFRKQVHPSITPILCTCCSNPYRRGLRQQLCLDGLASNQVWEIQYLRLPACSEAAGCAKVIGEVDCGIVDLSCLVPEADMLISCMYIKSLGLYAGKLPLQGLGAWLSHFIQRVAW